MMTIRNARIPSWTPCAIDPDGFSCRECAIGWLPHCRLRADDELRNEHASRWRREHHFGSLDPHRDRILWVAVEAILRRQQVSMPASLVHHKLPLTLRDDVTEQMVQDLLKSNPQSAESSPGMFRWSESLSSPTDVQVITLRPSTGVALDELLRGHEPAPSDVQTGWFRRIAAMTLACGLTDLESTRELAARRDVLLQRVIRSEGWSVTELVDVATGRKGIRAELLEADARERGELLSAILALELAAKRSHDELLNELVALKTRVLLSNSRLVAHEARRFTHGGFLRFGDLFQEGFLGLMHAATKYDPYRGYAFSTYATAWIRQRIWRAIDDQSRTVRLPVHIGERVRRVSRARDHLLEIGQRPTPLAVAHVAGVESPTEAIHLLRLDREPLELTPSIGERLIQLDYEAGLDSIEWRETLLKHVQALPLPWRVVLDRRYGLTDGAPQTLDVVGRGLGVTRERIRQIESKALNRLRTELSVVVTGVAYVPPPTRRRLQAAEIVVPGS